MTGRRLGRLSFGAALLLALSGSLAACGATASSRVPKLSALPLVRGAGILAQSRQCDTGANAFCGLELVVIDRGYRTADDVVAGERRLLLRTGWTGGDADTGDEKAADSPGHRLRVTYATAYGDEKGIDLRWIKRSQAITLTLSRALFDRAPAMSMMLETGAS